ncbi:2,3-bisphosphoglycerate-independent phosphoglycerate mutase [Zancudomyces culisetae]|uniref:2,3-bisphosphoglycerate-independent phosphoglycerate mutase n=1 Tax=Zancudomyces culisetae TaxID=1213189 RepID=A0A1R1PUF0_ZANCU|nr:2,3-bisphosphoglycerate-independent phosphoglycerate mutase [Zancudomyces culisetae]|eukprot:OMH84567.1 2,3-bisphosphoglycerate-independent phosphoglycerate mutase [Zancudomyces culisetae]
MVELKKVCLICIDGWGVNEKKDVKGDAIYAAETPVMTGLAENYPYREILAHGNAVGLPAGLMGNSEVGHLNIGAGRIVFQDIVRIDLALKKKEFGKIQNIKLAFETAKAKNSRLHFCGLVSDGGVHSHINHLVGLLEAAKEANVPEVYVHFFGDGRDTNPRSTDKYLAQLLGELDGKKLGKLATITGRYYAMDRDRRWERVQVAFEGMTLGKGEKTTDPLKTVAERYANDETDEFLKPIIVNQDGLVKEGDTMFFFNYRSDRMREIAQSFGMPPPPFDSKVPASLDLFTMTQYKSEFPFKVAFPPQQMNNVLAEWLASHGVKQCHLAETEKYAHVTFFFNGGTEIQFKDEDRVLIPSPKVATYDLKPEMSSHEVGVAVAEKIDLKEYPFVMCNFAPPDMVGHTGKYPEAVEAITATDKAIGIIYEACKRNGYTLFVTADHGNAEKMIAEDGSPHTAHTCSRVPLNITDKNVKLIPADSELDALCDVAPTILAYMGLPIPEEMTGRNLLA